MLNGEFRMANARGVSDDEVRSLPLMNLTGAESIKERT